jgi:hypothetical protein
MLEISAVANGSLAGERTDSGATAMRAIHDRMANFD